MKRAAKKTSLKNEKGFALAEALFFMMTFVILTVYTIDFFSIIHTGIVNNIAARTYLFETLAHRVEVAHLRYTDDDPVTPTKPRNDFSEMHYRFHAVTDEGQSDSDQKINASGRSLSMVLKDNNNDAGDWQAMTDAPTQRSVVWIKTGYGICIDAGCPRD